MPIDAGPRQASRQLPAVMVLGSLLLVAAVTLVGRPGAGSSGVSLVPGRTLSMYLEAESPWQLVVFGFGNVLLFVPLGISLFLALGHRVGAATVLGGAISVLVEVAQLEVGARSTDVDDVLLNTAGAFFGAVLALAGSRRP